MTSLVFEDLSLRYPASDRDCLERISLDFAPDSRSGLAGASGSGKTSLFLAATGLAVPLYRAQLSGRVRYGTADLANYRPQTIADYIGIVVQDPTSQIIGRTVAEDVAFGPRNHLEPPEQVNARVDRALEQVGLGGFHQRRTNELSGGEAQRLALAGVLAMHPDLVLLDEVTAQLDPEGSRMVTRVINDLSGQGVGTIVAGHGVGELATQSETITVLNRGTVAWQGSASDLLARGGQATAWGLRLPALARLFLAIDPAIERVPVSLNQAIDRLGEWGVPPVLPKIPSGRAIPGDVVASMRDVHFNYPNGVQALRGIDLDLRAGQIVALMGANGAGKTTLAKQLNGLLRPTDGSVLIGGEEIAGRPAWQVSRQVGYVFQNPDHQLFNPTVADELAYGIRHWGPAGRIAERVHQVAETFHLTSRLADNPLTLPLVLRKRLALASVVVTGPDVLVVDEPTAGADHWQQQFITERLTELADAGVAVVVITHDQEWVVECAGRVVLLAGGRVAADGEPGQILDHPLISLGCRYFGRVPTTCDPQALGAVIAGQMGAR